MNLSEEHLQTIYLEVEKVITISTLRDDLIDHLCCVTEWKMKNGIDFKTSFSEALQELAPDGLYQIQEEASMLLNSNKLIRMKKMMYFAGLVSCMAMAFGWTLNILGLSGGDMLTGSIAAYGFVSFALLFLPLASIESFKSNLKMMQRDKIRVIVGLVCALLTGTSVLLKILNWQESSQLLLLGVLLFVVGFLPLLFLNLYHRFKATMKGVDKARLIIGILSGFFTGVGILFKIFHLTGAVEIILLGAILFIFGFLPLLFFNMYKKAIA